jgi:hypothetical protein
MIFSSSCFQQNEECEDEEYGADNWDKGDKA